MILWVGAVSEAAQGGCTAGTPQRIIRGYMSLWGSQPAQAPRQRPPDAHLPPHCRSDPPPPALRPRGEGSFASIDVGVGPQLLEDLLALLLVQHQVHARPAVAPSDAALRPDEQRMIPLPVPVAAPPADFLQGHLA